MIDVATFDNVRRIWWCSLLCCLLSFFSCVNIVVDNSLSVSCNRKKKWHCVRTKLQQRLLFFFRWSGFLSPQSAIKSPMILSQSSKLNHSKHIPSSQYSKLNHPRKYSKKHSQKTLLPSSHGYTNFFRPYSGPWPTPRPFGAQLAQQSHP